MSSQFQTAMQNTGFSSTHAQFQQYQAPVELNHTNSHHGPQQLPFQGMGRDSYFAASRAWLQRAAADLRIQQHSPIIPGISVRHTYQRPKSPNPLYVPRALWNIRHLSPLERYEMYVEFCFFGQVMQNNRLDTPEYNSAFDLIVEKSKAMDQKERQWYNQFANPQRGTYEQRAEEVKAIVFQQARAVDIRNISSPSSASSFAQSASVGSQPGGGTETAIVVDNDEVGRLAMPHGQKRRASTLDDERDDRPSKRATTGGDEATQEEKAARADANHQRYLEQRAMIDAHYLQGNSTRKPEDPERQNMPVFNTEQAAQRGSLYIPSPQPATSQPPRPQPQAQQQQQAESPRPMSTTAGAPKQRGGVKPKPQAPAPNAPKSVTDPDAPFRIPAMEIVRRQINQAEPISVAGIKITKAEVTEGLMDCVKRVARALRLEAEDEAKW